MLTGSPVLGDDTVTVSKPIQPFTKHGTLVSTEACGGAAWDADCTWSYTFKTTISAADGIKSVSGSVDGAPKAVTNSPPLGECAQSLTESSFSHTFAVICPTSSSSPESQEFEIAFSATDCDTAGADTETAEGLLTLKCYKCAEGQIFTAVDSNGGTAVPASVEDQQVQAQFAVLNVSEQTNPVDLQVTAPDGWTILSPVPGQITLLARESEELLLDVIVPGGTADGTIGYVELVAGIGGDPSTEGSDSFQVIVGSPPVSAEPACRSCSSRQSDDAIVDTITIAGPNPSRQFTDLVLSIVQPGPVTASVYDVRGGVIRHLVDRNLMPGEHLVRWNGKDEHGRVVVPGVYFVRLSTRTTQATVRATLIR
jgi:hypothetical protein